MTAKVGDRVRLVRDVYDHPTKRTVPAGTTGVVYAAGVDAQFGHVVVCMDGVGVPMHAWVTVAPAHDPAAVIEKETK